MSKKEVVKKKVVPISTDMDKKRAEVAGKSVKDDPIYERFIEDSAYMLWVMEEVAGGVEIEHHPECSYHKDEFPRDIKMSERYQNLTEYSREYTDIRLMSDLALSTWCPKHRLMWLEDAYKKHDAIYTTAHKKWLRWLVNECQKHGLFDKGVADDT